MPLVHHELCFGCGRTNLFGLLVELERTGPNEVAGRCFIKQDHQGARPGQAHDGIVATALAEAMSLAGSADGAADANARGARGLATLAVSIEAAVPVGTFLELTAQTDGATATTASARSDGVLIATASGTYS
jgi:acyl-coenzyme A thioesterase PaaI-like protein